MESEGYNIRAEARTLFAPNDTSDELRVPIIVNSCNGSPKPCSTRSCCLVLLSCPRRVVSVVWSSLCIVLKLVFLAVSLMLYALLLMPGFLRMIFYYYFSEDVVRGIMYGCKPRQRLDMYFPKGAQPDAIFPVVIYVTGGAWTIGYRAWGALLARRLSEQGVLVACLDYRNFPQGDALDMLEDVNTGISWVLSRIHRFGGDPDSVTLVGQSAGGHLAGLALIKQAKQASSGSPTLGASPAWPRPPSGLRAFVGVSGAFDLVGLSEHRGGHFRGLLDRILALTEGLVEAEEAREREHEGAGKRGEAGQVDGKGAGGAGAREAAGPGEPGAGSAAATGLDPGVAGNEDLLATGDRREVGAALVEAGGAVRGEGGRSLESARGGSRWRHPVQPQPPAAVAKGCKRPAYSLLSPLQAAQRLSSGAAGMLPYVLLIHGTADKTVPAEGSAALCRALQSSGAPCCRCVLVPGKTHTAFLLEDPMRGGRDLLMDTVLGAVTGGRPGDVEEGRGQADAGGKAPVLYASLCPGFLCDLAGWVCPF